MGQAGAGAGAGGGGQLGTAIGAGAGGGAVWQAASSTVHVASSASQGRDDEAKDEEEVDG
ncbi:hypothetical protein [Rivibacter subsaxonicus]|uniref:hypothetical protein n=1 Tax=Rivibacter subsaxonicus TaxID=457575 RepID=UPI00102BA3C7|nr:hypothetical protein [Rivibacter subsaxonicus]